MKINVNDIDYTIDSDSSEPLNKKQRKNDSKMKSKKVVKKMKNKNNY